MSLSVTVPTIIAPTISLMLLAYNHKLSSISRLIRELSKIHSDGNTCARKQIIKLRKRVVLIQFMEGTGIFGLMLSLVSSFLIYMEIHTTGEAMFILAIICAFVSLSFALVEIIMSRNALDIFESCESTKKD